MRQIILDTETTGLQVADGHRIIEIGCIELINRKITGNRFHQYINPGREIENDAIKVHGITQQFLQDKPMFSAISEAFMDFISGAELIIHNAPFDVGFIDYELSLTQKKWKSLTEYCRIIDTLQLARQIHVGQRNSLDALCKRYNVDNSQRELHGALLDAHLLAKVYLAMTGGQSSLFAENEMIENKSVEQNIGAAVLDKTFSLNVIAASDDELKAHEAYLDLLAKNKCLWREEKNS